MSDKLCQRLPRVMIAAPSSGQGKTMITCAVLSLLSETGREVRAFKCGPDYIDPMFHRQVLGIPSYNLDSFFSDENTLRYLLGRHGVRDCIAEKTGGEEMPVSCPIGVIEGVMGYYDGLLGVTDRASSYDVARITKTPVVLVVDASGSSLSVLAVIKGFLRFRKNSRIRGVIFNRLSPAMYPAMREMTEKELGLTVLGYVPKLVDFSLESRHLGLIRPEEIPDFKDRMTKLADKIRPTLDMDALLRIAEEAAPLSWRPFAIPVVMREDRRKPVIAVAMDEAFCFYYQDNLELLEKMGARLRFFSPIEDSRVPKEADGLYLGGGYPELYGKELSENAAMRQSICLALKSGMPCIAECGGYLYLKEWLEDKDKNTWAMAGFLKGKGVYTGKLTRFGYVNLKCRDRDCLLTGYDETFPAHEFHYWDCEENGDCYQAVKPVSGRSWNCGYGGWNLYAAFPHLYFYSAYPYGFLRRAAEWKEEKWKKSQGEK